MKVEKSYIYQSLAIIVMASGFFLFFKGNLPEKLFSEEVVSTNNIVVDSLMLEAIGSVEETITNKDTLKGSVKEPILVSTGDERVIVVPEDALTSDEDTESFKGNIYLEHFFARLYALEQQKGKRVRIAYYGDSMTDGDLIVQDIRKSYQAKYGGMGVGYIPIMSESAQSRQSVIHKYSPNFRMVSYLNVKKPQKPFGVSGQVYFVKDTIKQTWVSYAGGKMQNMTMLYNPTLYYGSSNNKRGEVVVITNRDTIVKKLSINSELNKLKIVDGSVKEIKLTFKHADSIPIYGMDFSGAGGVQVDNFSSRGNSGLPISLFKTSLMQKYQSNLDYSLIVLHYGANVLNYGTLDYSWYTKKMSAVVAHLKQCFPNASILVISAADKSSKVDGVMQTDKAVVPLVKSQRKYAMEARTGFFNLYDAMGGNGSMIKWVEEAKANKDYTHFNHKGASAVAQKIFTRLEEGYQEYKKKHPGGTSVGVDNQSDGGSKGE
ncbi:hypothetical protein LNQ81_00715 [Myroides sp. M-43]|uniref:hypothetical protein n=1 Tax=Myroides oncorhynchi TaxID=2893756 RepID=UPI001E2A9C74|nr:hypothetical protein [Myroides oncorhynchi]